MGNRNNYNYLFLIDHTIGLRVSEIEEIEGLDIHEHGLVSAYAVILHFMASRNPPFSSKMMKAPALKSLTVPRQIL